MTQTIAATDKSSTPASASFPDRSSPEDPAVKKRVILADDDPLVRAAVAVIFNHYPGYEIVGQAANGDEAVALAAATQPDVLVLDVNMPQRGGLTVLHDLRVAMPKMRIVLLTVSIEKRQILEALQAGARGIVLKEAARSTLIKAVDSVLKGNFWADKRALTDVSALVKELRSDSKCTGSASQLTPREKQVVEFVVEGCTNKDIARSLLTSEQVIKNYMGKIFDKLGVFNRLELALYALDHDLARRH